MNAAAGIKSQVRLADLREPRQRGHIEAFVEGHPDSTVFHRPLWLEAVERGTGSRAFGLVMETAGTICAWLPLSEIASPFFGRALVSSGFGVGGGILADNSAAKAGLCQAAEELAQRLSVGSIELRGRDAVQDWDIIEGKHASFAAELQRDDTAQLGWITRKARAEVRKSLTADLKISHGRDAYHRRGHFAAYSESMRNLGTPIFPCGLFNAVLDLFEEEAEITLVQQRNAPVAAVLSLYHRGTVIPYWGGGTRAARELRASERMYYELMCHARRRSCKVFDFGRSKVGSGPYFFKKNWGFIPEPLIYRQWNAQGGAARNIDPTHAGYSSKIAMWQRLPLGVANRLGPVISRGLG